MPDSHSKLSRFTRVPFEVEVELDRVPITMREVLDLKVGSMVLLKKQAGENPDVLIGGSRIGAGEVVIIQDMMAVRLATIDGE